MSLRRMMLFTLGAYVQGLIDAFKTRVATTFGIFESESCLKTQLDDLNNKGVLQDAFRVATPNAYNEGILHTVIGPTITPEPYNLMTYTENFLGWSLLNVTRTTLSTINPTGGTQNIVVMSDTTTNGEHRYISPQNTTIFINTIYTASVFLKKGSGATSPDIVQLYLGTGFNGASYANFNINTGVVTVANLCTATIDNTGLSAGWWRCTITLQSTSETLINFFNIVHVNNNPSSVRQPTYAGVTTSSTLIWGPQLEISNTATTYQPIPFTALLSQGYAEFTRVSTATRVESTGLVREVPQENLFGRSEQFNTGFWSKSLSSVDGNSIIAPNGTLTAELFKEDTTTGRHSLLYAGAVSVVSGQTYNISVYVKKESQEWIQLNPVSNPSGFSINDWANFNLTTGTIGNKGTGAVADIQDAGNGWWRCSLDINPDTTQSTGLTLFVTTNNTNSGRYPSYLGTGASCFYIWGAQMTLDSGVKPYYPTILRQNTPRLDYSEGSCPSLLIEASLTNLILRSEEFQLWNNTNISVTQNTEIAPNGLQVADTLTATANSGYTRLNGIPSSADKVWSVYIKRKTGTGNVYLESGGNSTPVTINSSTWTRCFNLSRGMSSTFTISSGFHTITTSSPHRMITGDSIRINITSITSGSGAASVNAGVTVTSPTTYTFTSGTATATGTCATVFNFARIVLETAGDEIYVWGGQLESQIGAFLASDSEAVPSSYVPTTNVTVTKGTDNLVIENPSSNQKTFYFNLKRNYATNNTNTPLLYLGDGPTVATSTTSIVCVGVALGVLNWYYKINSGSVVSLATNTIYSPNQSDYFKVIITVDNSATNKFNIWMDGVYLVSSSVAMDVSLLNYTFLGNTQPILRLKEFDSWDRVLTNDEINDLFSYPYYNSGYSPVNIELQYVINRANYEGFTLPSSTVLSYCDTLITEMKNDGVWSVTDLFLNFAFNDVGLSNFARINWKQPNSALALATLNGGLTYQTNGFKGNGTNAFINTNYRTSFVSNYVLNNAGRLMVLSETGSSIYLDGMVGTNNNSIRLGSFLINSSNNTLTADNTGTGLRAIMRYNSSNVSAYNKSVQTSGTLASTSLNTNQQLIHRSFNNYGDTCISNYYLGVSLTSTQIANFRIYYNTFLTNLGLTPFA
jgi:hypothetical protein